MRRARLTATATVLGSSIDLQTDTNFEANFDFNHMNPPVVSLRAS